MEVVATKRPQVAASQALSSLLAAAGDTPTLLMLSGGSAFSLLDLIPPEVLGGQLTITVLDERYSTDPTVNNFAQLTQTAFYQAALAQGARIISTTVLPGESMEALRDRFDAALHAWKERHPKGVTIATMGIGPDGHTAGILPGDYDVEWNGEAWVVDYEVPKEVNQYPKRVTVTKTFLKNQVDEAIVYAVGPTKHSFIRQLAEPNPTPQAFPAQVLKEMPAVTLFTDENIR